MKNSQKSKKKLDKRSKISYINLCNVKFAPYVDNLTEEDKEMIVAGKKGYTIYERS